MARGLKGQMSQPYCGPNFSGESFLSRNLLNPLFHLEWYRNPAYIEQLLEGIYSLCAQFRRLINSLYIALSHLLFQLSNSEEELKAGMSPYYSPFFWSQRYSILSPHSHSCTVCPYQENMRFFCFYMKPFKRRFLKTAHFGPSSWWKGFPMSH